MSAIGVLVFFPTRLRFKSSYTGIHDSERTSSTDSSIEGVFCPVSVKLGPSSVLILRCLYHSPRSAIATVIPFRGVVYHVATPLYSSVGAVSHT